VVSTSVLACSVLDSMLTVGGTLGGRALATTTTDAGTVDNVTLLGLVSQTASLVGTAGAGSAVDDVQLAELYESTLSKCSTSTPRHRRTKRLMSLFFQVSVCRTSQQRTRSKKRMTSLCFFFCSSSRYLWAPICAKCDISQCTKICAGAGVGAARKMRSADSVSQS
jgi:hypothetical protein